MQNADPGQTWRGSCSEGAGGGREGRRGFWCSPEKCFQSESWPRSTLRDLEAIKRMAILRLTTTHENQQPRLERAVPAPPPGRLEMANIPHWVTISRNWRFIDFFFPWEPCTVSGLTGGWQCFHRQQCATFCPHGSGRAVFTIFNKRS